MMRVLIVTLAICHLIAASIHPAHAQGSVKDLAARASAELRLLTAFQTLERATSQLNHFLVYAVLAERGGWVTREFNNVPEGANANYYMIRGTAEDVQIDVARAKSTIMKSKVATEDELKGAETVVENMNALLTLAPQIANMVKAGKLDDAAVLYHEAGQSAFDAALRGAQSGVGTTSKRLGKTLLKIRIAQ